EYDLSTANQIRLQVEFKGDFNNDNVVDAADYVIWQKFNGQSSASNMYTRGDANGDKTVNAADYAIWRANFGKSITVAGSGISPSLSVPEPASIVLALSALGFFGCQRRRR